MNNKGLDTYVFFYFFPIQIKALFHLLFFCYLLVCSVKAWPIQSMKRIFLNLSCYAITQHPLRKAAWVLMLVLYL